MRRSPGEVDALGLLGLAQRAGALVTGVEATRRSLHAGEVRLVLLASDASDVQLQKVRGLLRHRDVPVRWVARRESIGRALGQGPLSVVGVKAASFATQLLNRLPPTPPDSPEGDEVKDKQQEEPRQDAGR